MPSKKSTRFTAHWMKSTHALTTPRGRITLVSLVCVVAAGILIAARQPAPPVQTPPLELQFQEVVVVRPEPTTTPAMPAPERPRQARNAAASTRAVTTAPVRPTVAADATPTKAAAPASNAPAIESTSTAAIVEAAAAMPRAEAASRAPAQAASAVTITGCLERDDDKFQLKDTSGEDAPRSRSWRSGFLRRGSASIDVIDGANRLRLPSHVGQRVSLTGTLVDREMQARSLQMVAADCDD